MCGRLEVHVDEVQVKGDLFESAMDRTAGSARRVDPSPLMAINGVWQAILIPIIISIRGNREAVDFTRGMSKIKLPKVYEQASHNFAWPSNSTH